MAMPLLFGGFLSFGATSYLGWRAAMIVPGIAMLLTGIAYYFWTQDTPDGNFKELRAQGKLQPRAAANGVFWEACKDRRVWALAGLYGSCFGIELTIDNVAALYFTDYFGLSLKTAGFVAASFGMMNIFARALGGAVSDRLSVRWGLRGRVMLLGGTIAAEGVALMLFSQATWLPLAIGGLMLSGLFVKMSNGATYSVVPFVNKRAVGAVAGIVGAGGNAGSVLAGLLFKSATITWPVAFLIVGAVVAASASLAFLVRFSEKEEKTAYEDVRARMEAVVLEAA
jgi:NNP family nitrate/nitrite transporter-like MFS transporter